MTIQDLLEKLPKHTLKRRRDPSIFRKICNVLKPISIAIAAFVSIWVTIHKSSYPTLPSNPNDIDFILKNSITLFLVATFVNVFSTISLWYINRASAWSIMKEVIDSIDNAVFADRNSHDNPYHRVTLFKKKSYKILALGFQYQTAMVRSNETLQRTRVRFEVSDDPTKCKGIVGKALNEAAPVPIYGLDDITPPNTSERKYASYASKTNMPISWVKKHHTDLFARSYYAMRIEVNRKAWGTLVFDSKSPEPININKFAHEFPVTFAIVNNLIKEFRL